MIIAKFKLVIFSLLTLPHILWYITHNHEKVNKDIEAFAKLNKNHNIKNYYISLYKFLILNKAFRNVYYMRTGPRWRHILNATLKEQAMLSIGIRSENCGGGFLVQHGNSTIVLANSIGENFWINQNVTVGWTEKGCPRIGNNVRIGTGAVVLGPINIGNNVKIGAGAIVMKDVPDNTTVVSPHAYIVKKNGIRVNLPL